MLTNMPNPSFPWQQVKLEAVQADSEIFQPQGRQDNIWKCMATEQIFLGGEGALKQSYKGLSNTSSWLNIHNINNVGF